MFFFSSKYMLFFLHICSCFAAAKRVNGVVGRLAELGQEGFVAGLCQNGFHVVE